MKEGEERGMKGLQVFSGENAYAMNQEIQKIAREGGYSIQEVPDALDMQGMVNLLNTSSLFDGPLLYLFLEDAPLTDGEGLVLLQAYLENPNPENLGIILAGGKSRKQGKDEEGQEGEEASGKRAAGKVRTFLKAEGLWKSFDKMKPQEVKMWIRESFYQKGYSMDQDALDYLLEVVGTDQEMLTRELEKIELYQPMNHKITLALLKELVAGNVQSNIFALTDNILGNKDVMMGALENLFLLKYPEAMILHMVIRELRQMLLVKWHLESGANEKTVMDKAGISFSWQVQKKSRAVRRMPYPVLLRNLRLAYEADYRIKTGKGDQAALIRSALLSMEA